jgi:hypothetical protein
LLEGFGESVRVDLSRGEEDGAGGGVAGDADGAGSGDEDREAAGSGCGEFLAEPVEGLRAVWWRGIRGDEENVGCFRVVWWRPCHESLVRGGVRVEFSEYFCEIAWGAERHWDEAAAGFEKNGDGGGGGAAGGIGEADGGCEREDADDAPCVES